MIFYTAGMKSTLDSKLLSSREIQELSDLMMYSDWPSLACMLDVPIFPIRTYYAFEGTRIVLFLYNNSRHFSRKRVVECCKEFLSFEEINKILR